MVTIYNTDLIKELKDGAKLQQLREGIPSQLGNSIIPVMEVNPKLLRRANIAKNQILINGTTGTIYLTPTDKDFFMTNIVLAYIKDATATSILISLRATIDGVSCLIATLPAITLTAAKGEIALSFNSPIKVDKNTNITINSSTNNANITVTGNVIGYLVENINA